MGLTWGQLKAAVAAEGIADDMEVASIEIHANPRTDITLVNDMARDTIRVVKDMWHTNGKACFEVTL